MRKKAHHSVAAEVTFEEKKAAIHALIKQKELVPLADLSNPIYDRLLNEMVEAMDGDAAKSHRYFLSQWMSGGVPIELHEGAMPAGGALYEVRDEGSRIHLYAGAGDGLMAQLESAMALQGLNEPEAHTEVIIAETDAARTPKGESPKAPLKGTGGSKTTYDPTAEDISVEKGRKAHTPRHLREYGKMRMSKSGLSEEEMQSIYERLNEREKHRHLKYDHKSDTAKRENIGGRWLWEKLHEYLLDERTLQEKSPSRWFRDMCVLCGISTTLLAQEMSVHQNALSLVQNGGCAADTSLKYIRNALQLYFKNQVDTGYGVNTGARRTNSFKIPAGSAFGLPTIVLEDGTKQVDSAAVETILKPLFGKDYSEPKVFNAEIAQHIFQQIKRISEAHQQGALSRSEVMNAHLVQGDDSKLHQLVKHYGLSSKYPAVSSGYSLLKSIFKHESTNMSSLCETLRHMNQQHWKLPNEEIELMLSALRFVPANEQHLFHDDHYLSKEEAWRYATTHHDGTIGNLLATYRQVRGVSTRELLKLKKISIEREVVSQYERGDRSENSTCNRALSYKTKNHAGKQSTERYLLHNGSLENMWDLPMDEQGKEIRADVVKYIDHFRARSDARKPPAAHWKTVENIFDDLAETPAGINLDLDIYRNSPVLGRHTEALREEKQHPLLAKINRVIDEHLALYPDEPLPLITLPNGVELLVKRGEEGEPPRLLESELPLWRDWLLSEAKNISAPSARRAQSVSGH